VINYKDYAMQEHAVCLTWSVANSVTFALFTAADTSVSNKSWGYIKDDTFKSPEFVVHQLIDIVSKNGNLLMNIGLVRTAPSRTKCSVYCLTSANGSMSTEKRFTELAHGEFMARARRKWRLLVS